ncbi:MAG: HAMP domain-containing histidine kinase [Candidatus Buchananbacteria bacterium]|nr:HAMP domain-containing histidine kinase [Candidatus Buchananbacteria bacterium]
MPTFKKSNKVENIKSDFITVASHQLRTPISGIRWSLDTLLSGRAGLLTEKQIEIVQEAYRNNKFMVKVVNDLLRVSRFEEKGLNLQPKFISLKKIITEAIEELRPLATANNCEIFFDAGKNIPNVYVDPLQLKPVVFSFIDNSILYSKAKGKVKISLKKVTDFVFLKIEDNGIGIPANEQELVFSKFFRGSNAMKAQTEGIGLDLYLAKEIIEQSGGKISFQSREDRGTTFNIYLPYIKVDVDGKPTMEAEAKNINDVLKKEREFVSITVHELKAPLGITKWSLEMLKNQKQGKLNKNQLELIDQVYRGNERLLVLVRDLLNLSKLQEGKFEIEPKEILFESVIDDVVKGFSIQANKSKVKLIWKRPAKPFGTIKADPNRVAQVVTNIVSNAIKYTPANGKVILALEKVSGADLKKISQDLPTANLSFTSNKNGYLVLSIKDSGIGISDEDQNKLFTRFFRSKKVLTSKTEGTGLGLYITKSIVNLHRGDIWFTSKLGSGSTFYISLPIA